MRTFEEIVQELDINKQVFNIPYSYRSALWGYMKEKYPKTNLQLGDMGDYGLCAFVGEKSIIIPVKDDTYLEAI